MEFAVEEVPPSDAETYAASYSAEAVRLSRLVAAATGTPARIVLYRRPIEARAVDEQERAALVHDVVVEEVADLLGLEPEAVDPGYADPDA